MRRQFFSFFMPRLHRQLYRGLCLSASMALRHSSLASRPATELKLLSLPPATHCLMVRYLVLHACSFRHCSLALTQSIRVVLARRFSSAEDRTSGNTNGVDENSLGGFLPQNVAHFWGSISDECTAQLHGYNTAFSTFKTTSEIRSSEL